MPADVCFEGRNLDAAIEKACNQLEVKKEQLRYKVLSPGSKGIFGFLCRRKAKIRVIETDPKNFEKPHKTLNTLEKKEFTTHPQTRTVRLKASNDAENRTQPGSDHTAAVERGRTVLEKIVFHISKEAIITIESRKDRTVYNIRGGNPAVLIGKKGQTLEAINYIIDRAVNKNCSPRIRLKVDIEGYLKNKKKKLQEMAKKLSQKAVRTGRVTVIEQINAQDRRIVHLALKGNRKIRTQSKGRGVIRDLLIIPRKKISSSDR